MNIRTFDEESRVIDSINGDSVIIDRDKKFDSSDSEGHSNEDSSVIRIFVGNNEVSHVGSSLIMAEEGLDDLFDEYVKTADVNDTGRTIPIVNNVVNSFKNITLGKTRTILIRSQNGTPLATYVGDKVSTFAVDIPKTTVFLVDGKLLLLYRCDYTVYDTELLLD